MKNNKSYLFLGLIISTCLNISLTAVKPSEIPRLAFATAMHPRCGADSSAREITDPMIDHIFSKTPTITLNNRFCNVYQTIIGDTYYSYVHFKIYDITDVNNTDPIWEDDIKDGTSIVLDIPLSLQRMRIEASTSDNPSNHFVKIIEQEELRNLHSINFAKFEYGRKTCWQLKDAEDHTISLTNVLNNYYDNITQL